MTVASSTVNFQFLGDILVPVAGGISDVVVRTARHPPQLGEPLPRSCSRRSMSAMLRAE